MAPPARSSAPLFLLLVVLLVAARRSAGDDDSPPQVQPLDPKCQEMTEMCTPATCTKLCLSIGLGKDADGGFCTFHGMQFYCCCPIPAPVPPPSRL
ncbi:hypothetical protein CFC21_085250 [Triticum aestivum]|uniref:Knottin scorpion toxin-like domain-containing protein n=2 Tax=Triticum aestivum TaxID=4565 RepID=A0A9R1L884_WHEAT|nr:hypothetical protein CFC21_085249 [Triticum aestivum]KAF7081292.1 hypothetical protein CFC21_085250 [Triticum aestivum]